jgi:DNA-binding transcriptional MerR regulator
VSSAILDNTSRFYRSREVSQILGLSRRQLQYWAQTDLVRPSTLTAGGHHRYSFQDLVALKAARRLIDAGVSVQRIRSSIQTLRNLLPSVHQPLAELVLVATGDVVLVFREGAVFDAVSGQEWVFEIAQLVREIDLWRDQSAGFTQRARTSVQERSRKQA